MCTIVRARVAAVRTDGCVGNGCGACRRHACMYVKDQPTEASTNPLAFTPANPLPVRCTLQKAAEACTALARGDRAAGGPQDGRQERRAELRACRETVSAERGRGRRRGRPRVRLGRRALPTTMSAALVSERWRKEIMKEGGAYVRTLFACLVSVLAFWVVRGSSVNVLVVVVLPFF